MSKSIATAYKLFKIRKNGTLGPLYINKRQVIPVGKWLDAENHPTKGFKERPGWHTAPVRAQHLSERNRAWYRVQIKDFYKEPRPKNQGGYWLIAKHMKVLGPVIDEPEIECPDCGRFHSSYYQAERCTCNRKIG